MLPATVHDSDRRSSLSARHLDEIQTSGALFLSFAAACKELDLTLDDTGDSLADVVPHAFYPLRRFAQTYEAVVMRAADPETTAIAIGVEMMRAWYRFGPGRSIVRRGLDFLYFQTGSEGYRSVMQGPAELVGAFQLESVDLNRGAAVVRSTTPLWRDMERGVIQGGLELTGDIQDVEVTLTGDQFDIRFRRVEGGERHKAIERYCPLCDASIQADICSEHHLPTVDVAALEFQQQLEPGYILGGRHRIVEELGRGGMGVVYRAEQLSMGREVAVKTLKADGRISTDTLRRFYGEAFAASRLDHPNVVRVLDFGVDEASSTPFITMELAPGESLHAMLGRAGPLPPAFVARMGAQIACGLAAAHAQGVVHRDLKPSNVVVHIDRDGVEVTKVVDFGLASAKQRAADSKSKSTGGTPRYMSPEQILGTAVDWRCDIYSLGLTLCEALLDVAPFDDTTDEVDIARRKLEGEVPDLSHIDAPELVSLLRRMMSADPAKRARDTKEVAAALRAGATNEPFFVSAPPADMAQSDASDTVPRRPPD